MSRLERIPEAWLVFPEDNSHSRLSDNTRAIPVHLRNNIGSRLQVRNMKWSHIGTMNILGLSLVLVILKMLLAVVRLCVTNTMTVFII